MTDLTTTFPHQDQNWDDYHEPLSRIYREVRKIKEGWYIGQDIREFVIIVLDDPEVAPEIENLIIKMIEEIGENNENYELPVQEESETDKLLKEIREALEGYKGEDKQDIRAICIEKFAAGEIDREFTDNILSQLK